MFKVYIVDDDQVILDELVTTIPWMDNGFVVVGSNASPFVAIEEIAALCPDAVFTDLKMPDMDGVELTQQLQDNGHTCEFVMISAYDSFEDSRRFFRLCGFDYILKPVNQQEVQIVLERLAARLSKTRSQMPEKGESITPAFVELIAYLNENYNQRHTLESLAKQFCLGTNYICNLFAKHYNSTLTRYVTRLRMEAALEKMQTPGRAYKEVAIDCGYSDYYYFCKVFKEFYGASPTGYMKSHHKK